MINRNVLGEIDFILSIKLKPILVLGLFLSLILAFHVHSIYAFQQSPNIEITPELTIKGEYDDNINLNSGINDLNSSMNEEIKDDFILHLIPAIDFIYSYAEHKFSLDFNADYREGSDSDLNELNLNLVGNGDLNFPGGLLISLSDEFNKSSFDQALYDETGISKNLSNKAGIDVSYTLMERLKVGAQYDHKREEFKEGTDELKEEKEKIKRDIHTLEGKFSFPINDLTIGYTSYFYEEQKSKQKKHRDYDDSRFLLGSRWSGPYRFSAWAEFGYEKIDYKEAKDYSSLIGEIGLEVNFTEVTSGTISLGWDVYEKAIYDVSLGYEPSEDRSLSLSLSKKTITSFSSTSSSSFYELTNISLEFSQRLIERVTATFRQSYQEQKFSENRDKIWITRLSLDYPIQEMIKVGADYQFATKKAAQPKDEYDNNRVGLFLIISF